MENKGMKIGQRQKHVYTENVNKYYYQKDNIDYSENPKVILRELQPKV